MNINNLLSYNKILNFVMGDKTNAVLSSIEEYGIKRFIKHGEQFIYLKRHKTELKNMNNYFDKLSIKFPDHHFTVKGRQFYINGSLAGWAIPLSSWQGEKSNTYPDVTTIIFDGFIKKNNEFGRYLPNETGKLLNFMDTVIRERDNVRCFCIDQTYEIVNPYFLYFSIVPNLKQTFNVYKDIAIAFCNVEESASINFTKGFINNNASNLHFLFKIINNKDYFGCWYDMDDRSILISDNFIEKSKRFIKVRSMDLKDTMIGIKEVMKVFSIDIILDLFKHGNVNFSSKSVRDYFYKIFNSMMR